MQLKPEELMLIAILVILALAFLLGTSTTQQPTVTVTVVTTYHIAPTLRGVNVALLGIPSNSTFAHRMSWGGATILPLYTSSSPTLPANFSALIVDADWLLSAPNPAELENRVSLAREALRRGSVVAFISSRGLYPAEVEAIIRALLAEINDTTALNNVLSSLAGSTHIVVTVSRGITATRTVTDITYVFGLYRLPASPQAFGTFDLVSSAGNSSVISEEQMADFILDVLAERLSSGQAEP